MLLGPRDSPTSSKRALGGGGSTGRDLLSTPISQAHGISTQLDAAYESKFELGVLSRPRARTRSPRTPEADHHHQPAGERRMPAMALGEAGHRTTRGQGGQGKEAEQETDRSPADATNAPPRLILSMLATPTHGPTSPSSSPPALSAVTPITSSSFSPAPRLSSPTSSLSPKESRVALAARFLSHDEAARRIPTTRTDAHAATEPIRREVAAERASHANGREAANPDTPRVFSTFTIYQRGYLKQKCLRRDTTEVVRGAGGEKRYFVWHSKGLSMYPSESDYLHDRPPLKQMLNAWNNRYASEVEEDVELPELILMPYHTNEATGAGGRNGQRSTTSGSSESMLRSAHRDELLLRLLLATPSSVSSGVGQLPPSATLMVLKASTTVDAKEWLGAANRIHYARVRDRALHTNILPTLHSLLEDPSGFLMAHAPPSKQPAAETAGGDEGESSPTATTRAIECSEITPTMTTSTASTTASTSTRDLFESLAAAATPANTLVSALPPIPPFPAAATATAAVAAASDPSDAASILVQPKPLKVSTLTDSVGLLALDCSATPSSSPASPFSATPSSRSFASAESPAAFSPRAVRAMSIVATGGAAADPVQHATSTCEYYGLNGETPLYPPLPMTDVTPFSLHAAAPPSSAAPAAVVTLDMLGPRRCTVHDLLQWLLFQYPGSTYQLVELLPAAEPTSPTGAHSSSASGAWSHAHLAYAFLLFRGAYLDSVQLVEWLALAWADSAALPEHDGHHVRANTLWLLLVWVEYFRRDYLHAKEHIDSFLKSTVFPEAARLEAERRRRGLEGSDTTTPSCREWTTRRNAAQVARPMCINMAHLAVHLSHIIALTSGQGTPAIAAFMDIPQEYLHAAPPPAAGGGPASPSRPTHSTSPSGDATATSPVASQLASPQSVLARTATAPFQRRASFAIRSATTGATVALATTHPNSPSPAPLSPHGAPPRPSPRGLTLGSQSHRPPQCFAHRASTMLFVKKFVGFGGASLRQWSAREIACEMTNMDVESLQCIHTRELAHKAWTNRTPSLRAAHAGSAVAFIDSFNRRSFWAASEVLKAAGDQAPASPSAAADGGLAVRVDLLVHMIHILEELLALRNFYGAFAVLNGLGLQPLYRLHQLWSALPARSVSQLESLKKRLDSKGNQAAYRAMVKQAAAHRLAHVPHFAVLLKDLFQLEELPTFAELPPDPSGAPIATGVSASPAMADVGPPLAPSQHLNWSKFSKQYVELHNSLLVAQNSVHLYEQAQLVPDSTSTTGTVLRPALPPSDPSLRMCLHLSLARVWNEEKLYAFSYKLKPKTI